MSREHNLPKGWIWTTLGTIAKVNPGIDGSTVQDTTLVSFVPMAAVEAGTGKMNVSAQRQLKDVRHGYTAFQERDVLFAKITPCMENGKSAVAHSLSSGIGFGSTEFHVLRTLAESSPQLLYYYISQDSFRKAARSRMTGTAGQLRVPASYLAEVPFPLAPLPEQERIVAAIEQQLSRIDAGVALFRQAQKKLKQYRASVLKAAVEGTLTTEWRAEHPNLEPASELLKRILKERRTRWEEEQRAKGRDPKNVRYAEPVGPDVSGLPCLPEGWCWATLKQISILQRGRFSIRPRNDPRYYGGIFPFIQIRDLPDDGGKITTFQQTLNEQGCRVSREFPIGTVVVSIAASIGTTGILTFPSFFPDSLVGIICPFISMSNYVSLFIRTQKQKLQTYSYSSGGQPNINLPVLENLMIPLPPLAEQEQIISLVEERLSLADALETAIEHGLKRAERERQSILHQAFTGQLVAQDPNDEPASVLLERIRKERHEREKQTKQAQRTYSEKKEFNKRKQKLVAEARPVEFVQPELIDADETVQGELWQGIS